MPGERCAGAARPIRLSGSLFRYQLFSSAHSHSSSSYSASQWSRTAVNRAQGLFAFSESETVAFAHCSLSDFNANMCSSNSLQPRRYTSQAQQKAARLGAPTWLSASAFVSRRASPRLHMCHRLRLAAGLRFKLPALHQHEVTI